MRTLTVRGSHRDRRVDGTTRRRSPPSCVHAPPSRCEGHTTRSENPGWHSQGPGRTATQPRRSHARPTGGAHTLAARGTHTSDPHYIMSHCVADDKVSKCGGGAKSREEWGGGTPQSANERGGLKESGCTPPPRYREWGVDLVRLHLTPSCHPWDSPKVLPTPNPES